jgi:hypothetical protein
MKQHAAPATAQDMADHAPAGGLRAVALVLAAKPERAVSPHRSGCGLWERRPWPMGRAMQFCRSDLSLPA